MTKSWLKNKPCTIHHSFDVNILCWPQFSNELRMTTRNAIWQNRYDVYHIVRTEQDILDLNTEPTVSTYEFWALWPETQLINQLVKLQVITKYMDRLFIYQERGVTQKGEGGGSRRVVNAFKAVTSHNKSVCPCLLLWRITAKACFHVFYIKCITNKECS